MCKISAFFQTLFGKKDKVTESSVVYTNTSTGTLQKYDDKIVYISPNSIYTATINLNKGGEMDDLTINGTKVINRYWMHSSPEGAADGSDMGYEMSKADNVKIYSDSNKVITEGRMCQSNGSKNFFGHWYRRTYTFFPWGMEVEHDLWISPESIQDAKNSRMFSQWGHRPPMFYVWAVPVDTMRELDHWNCNWKRCWEPDNGYYQHNNLRWGKIPAPKSVNAGFTATPDDFDDPISMTIYKPNGIGLKRIIKAGQDNIDQLNVWYNWQHDVSHTLEVSLVGGDLSKFEDGARFLTPFTQESYTNANEETKAIAYSSPRRTNPKFSETIILGYCDEAGNLTPLA